MYKIKNNRIAQSHYVIFITEVSLLMFTRFHLKFQFRAYYIFIYPPDLFSVDILLEFYSWIVAFNPFL